MKKRPKSTHNETKNETNQDMKKMKKTKNEKINTMKQKKNEKIEHARLLKKNESEGHKWEEQTTSPPFFHVAFFVLLSEFFQKIIVFFQKWEMFC